MSRLAKNPIEIPKGVEITIDGGLIRVKGPKGELSRSFKSDIIEISTQDNTVVLTIEESKNSDVFARSLWGTYASHITNMIQGVTEGYQKALLVEGVGFRVGISGKNLEMQLGFSHPVIVEIPDDLEVAVEKNKITIAGIDKERVGLFAAKVRSKKKPEPYKGKGIRYEGEIILRKQGKKTV